MDVKVIQNVLLLLYNWLNETMKHPTLHCFIVVFLVFDLQPVLGPGYFCPLVAMKAML